MYSVTIELTEATNLEIGIKTTATIDASSTKIDLYADNFTVSKVSTDDNGNSTGITSIQQVANTSNAIYNIQGMRVSDTSKKGLYIINGKKVLVK